MTRIELLKKLEDIEYMRLKADKLARINIKDVYDNPTRSFWHKKRAEVNFAISDRLDKYFKTLKERL